MTSIQPPPQHRQQSFPIPDQIIHGSKAMLCPERFERLDFIGEHAAQVRPRIGWKSHLSIPRQRIAGEYDTVVNGAVHQPFLASRSRRLISRSIASRMNSARLLGPASSSTCATTSADRRTSVATVVTLALSGGRPIREFVADIGKFVKSTSKALSLIDVLSDIAYVFNQIVDWRTE